MQMRASEPRHRLEAARLIEAQNIVASSVAGPTTSDTEWLVPALYVLLVGPSDRGSALEP